MKHFKAPPSLLLVICAVRKFVIHPAAMRATPQVLQLLQDLDLVSLLGAPRLVRAAGPLLSVRGLGLLGLEKLPRVLQVFLELPPQLVLFPCKPAAGRIEGAKPP